MGFIIIKVNKNRFTKNKINAYRIFSWNRINTTNYRYIHNSIRRKFGVLFNFYHYDMIKFSDIF